jgi:hypothetical protein
VSDDGMRSLAGLTALTKLNLCRCVQVSDDGLQALAGLTTAVTHLNLGACSRVSDDGMRALAGLTALACDVMCTFIVVIRIFEVMISSPHQTRLEGL